MAREGWLFILPVIILAAIALLTQWYVAAILLGALAAFLLAFFRDPRRRGSEREVDVLSPADGTVIHVREVEEGSVWPGLTRQISILMSVFDVHVNRAPITGKVVHVRYTPARQTLVLAEKSSPDNEQNLVVIDDGRRAVAVRQIAGLLARRIVCDLREGDTVARGERVGMIRFGSRVDLFLPGDADVMVSLRDRVKTGLTVLARFGEPA